MKKIQSVYYNQSKKIFIQCKIEDHEIYNESKFLKSKHVNYIITINTFYKNWTIKKRFTEFEQLHEKLSKKISNLPEFPQKRLFCINEETILERKIKFESYLNFIFKNVNICVYPEILDFIGMEKELLSLFMMNNSCIENSSNSEIKRSIFMRGESEEKNHKSRSYEVDYLNDNYFNSFLEYKSKLSDKKEKNSKSANMLVIEEFLRNLQFKYENKIDIVNTFEKFLKSKKNWPTFKLDELSKLFYGDIVTDNSIVISSTQTFSRDLDKIEIPLKGLIYHIGSREENLLGSEACLEFLGKLINFEFNPECEAYIYMLKITKLEQLKNLRLVDHINTGKNNLIFNCFFILRAIILEDKSYINKLKKLINDEKIVSKFLLWYENNSI